MVDADRKDFALYTLDIDKYFILSTTLSVFLWPVLYAGIINFYLGYVLIIANTALLFSRGEVVIHRNHAFFLITLTSISALAAALTNNRIASTATQMLGISLFSIYHYSVIYRTNYSLTRIMEIYVAWAKFAAAFGYPIWIINRLQGNTLYRFHSWFAEPSHYAYVTLPAASYCLLKTFQNKSIAPSTILLLFSYILADSSTCYIGMGITILMLTDFRSLKKLISACALVIVAAYFTYNLSANVRLRVNDTLNAEISTEASDAINTRENVTNPNFAANATTFAMVSSAYVAWNAFITSPIIGNGLGTYAASYDKYAPNIIDPKFLLFGLNRDDANSLALRLMSELGITGLIGLVLLVFYFGRVRGTRYTILRNAIVPYFIMRTIRLGAYFSLENFFFMMIYSFNYFQYKASLTDFSSDPKI